MSKELAVQKVADYAIMKYGNEQLRELLAANIGTGGVEASDLQKVLIPGSGGKFWEVETIDGSQSMKEITGVIIAFASGRAYWKKPYGQGASGPPDCSSKNLVVGVGDPGGECHSCPLNEYGSAADGPSKACKENTILFVVREDSILPVVIKLPPTSLRNFRRYKLMIAGFGLKYSHIVTRIGLEPDKSQGGTDYSKATFAKGEHLDPEAAKRFDAMGEAFSPQIKKVAAEQLNEQEG